jgi:CIC family chloride channel protein
LFVVLMRTTGHYYVQGVGYATIMDVLTGSLHSVGFLVALALLKLAATCLTLGSGASGGVFSPSLFMGATLGAAYGLAVHRLFPGLPNDPRLFALAGMAAAVAGATSAALTAVVMLFEMTLDYTVILPLTLAAAVSYGLRRLVLPYSIYTLKLARRGHVMPEALQANAHLVHHVADLALADVQPLAADASPAALGELTHAYVVLLRDQQVTGVLTRTWLAGHVPERQRARSVEELARRDFVVVSASTTVFDLIASLQRAHAGVAVLARAGRPQRARQTARPSPTTRVPPRCSRVCAGPPLQFRRRARAPR